MALITVPNGLCILGYGLALPTRLQALWVQRVGLSIISIFPILSKGFYTGLAFTFRTKYLPPTTVPEWTLLNWGCGGTKISYSPSLSWNPFIAEHDLELLILLLPHSGYYDSRHVSFHLFCAMLGIKPRALCIVGMNSANEFNGWVYLKA